VAERLARAARAAQQLCDVLWEALHEELLHPDSERVKALSERLAEVSSTVAMLAATAPRSGAAEPSVPASSAPGPSASGPSVAGPDAPVPGAAASPAGPGASAPSTAAPAGPVVERRTPPEPSRPQPAPSDPRPDLRLAPHPSPVAEPPSGDERRSTPEPRPYERSTTSELPSTQRLPPEPEPPVALQPIPTRAGDYTFTKLVDEHDTAATIEPVEPAAAQIEIRDVRREEGPSAWVSSVGGLLQRHAQDGLPFSVLLVEIVDVARLERSETPHDMHDLVAQVESALGRGMRTTDRLSRETLGRYWLVAPETNGTGARMLAERLARLVRTSASHRGVPLEVAIGIAVCPEDGTEAPALAARADLGVYSARATGRSIAHTDPPA
jgi:GGDEF domain-containing protein